MEKKTKKFKISNILLIVLLGLAAFLEFYKVTYVPYNETLNEIVSMTISRIVAGLFFLVLILTGKYNVFNFKNGKEILLVLPCFLIAVNNMPIYALITKQCEINASILEILMFGLECFAVGVFEEFAFRGVFLPLVLEKHHNTRKEVLFALIITSCVFGLYHILNIFMGAGIGPTLLQVCYSALIGAMCGCAFLITGNVLVAVILHGIYNFCGMIVPTLGEGDMLNVPTIVVTAALSVVVFVYMLILFLKREKLLFMENFKL